MGPEMGASGIDTSLLSGQKRRTFLMEIFKKRHADRIDEKGAVEGATAVGEEAVYRVVKKSQCC